MQWYDQSKRDLPWRQETTTPYHTWLSEMMLQQTTVVTVIPYFLRFIEKWPNVQSLASAELDEVLTQWQGLGYYARARNLHKCAKIVSQDYEGRFPSTEAALLKLPGIGPYSAAAISAIAHNQHSTVVDGNVVRVLSRIYDVRTPYPDSKPSLVELAKKLTCSKRPGDYAQAIMDLGATVCTPTNPKCSICPWSTGCLAYKGGNAQELPYKTPKPGKPTRQGTALILENKDGEILLRKRVLKGLLAGMMEVPTSLWEEKDPPKNPSEIGGVFLKDSRYMGEINHTFTHFHLILKCYHMKTSLADVEGIWAHPSVFHTYALPTVMKKILKLWK